MPIDVLLQEAKELPDEYIGMALDYIQFLKFKYNQDMNRTTSVPKRKLGIMADKFHSMATDFDNTPDCFKEYM